MTKGSIVLVPFPFTDLTGNKLRPALVLIESKDDVTVVFITTQIYWKEEHDIILEPSIESGIKQESLIRLSKFATLDRNLILGLLGRLNNKTLKLVDHNLKKLLNLD